jgi:hypothetical protein
MFTKTQKGQHKKQKKGLDHSKHQPKQHGLTATQKELLLYISLFITL